MLTITGKTIYMTRADSATIQVIPKVKDEQEEWVPYTLAEGDQIVFRLKIKADDAYQVVCEKDCVLDLTENTAILNLVPEDTQACEFKEYRYELELITAADFHCTFIENQQFKIGRELETHE